MRSTTDAVGAPAFAEPELHVRLNDRPMAATSLASRPRETTPGARLESHAPSVQRQASGLSRSELPLAPVAANATQAMQRTAAIWDSDAEAPNPGATNPASVQRAPDGDAAPAEGPAVSAAASSAAAAAAPGDSEKDMDELAGKLYDRLRSRLRSELLIDRERAGLLTDWR